MGTLESILSQSTQAPSIEWEAKIDHWLIQPIFTKARTTTVPAFEKKTREEWVSAVAGRTIDSERNKIKHMLNSFISIWENSIYLKEGYILP